MIFALKTAVCATPFLAVECLLHYTFVDSSLSTLGLSVDSNPYPLPKGITSV